MHVPGLAAVGGDRLRPRRHQRRDLLQLPDQGAGGDLEPVGGQRRDDPVHRAAQHILLMQQPGQEPGGEQPLRHHLGAGGAQTVFGPGRDSGAGSGGAADTIRIILTCQSISSLSSVPMNSYGSPQRHSTAAPAPGR